MNNDLSYKDLLDILSGYPHIQQKLLDLWGTYACREYINGLIFNTSGRVTKPEGGIPRNQGFPLSVIQAITNLKELHDKIFPQFGRKKYTSGKFVWD